MPKETQETPLQKAMAAAGASTPAELQAIQAAQRTGQPVSAPPEAKPEATTPVEEPKASRKQGTPIVDDGSPLAQAAQRAKVETMEELQAMQAAARATAIAQPPQDQALNELASESLSGLSLEELAKAIRAAEDEHEVLSRKVSKAQAKVNEIRAHVDGLRAQYIARTQVPNAVANQEYLESVKRTMQDRFASAVAASKAIATVDPQLQLDKDALGLGKSPLDRAIAGELQAKRRAESRAALQVKK